MEEEDSREVDLVSDSSEVGQGEAHEHFMKWVDQERQYAAEKFRGQRDGHDEQMVKDGFSNDSFWQNQVTQYFWRANVLGLDNPSGRQALAKAYMTLGGAVESMIRSYGPLPEPGHPSGEVREWKY
jgi:hypothetical protein